MKIIAYHGGNLDNGVYNGHLYFTDDIETAKLYGGENNPNYKLYKCELTFENPLELDDEEYDEYMQQMDNWEQPIREGYDSIISTETGFATYYVALNPIKQVKILKVLKSLKEDFNDNFWKWFKKSKVVDKNKQPKIVYHGSQKKDIEIFKPERGFIIDGIYFSDNLSVAAHWSGDSDIKRIDKVKDADTVEELLQILNTYTKAEIKGYELIGDDKGTFYRLETYGGDTSVALGYKVDENTYEFTTNEGAIKRTDIKEKLKKEIKNFADSANSSGNYACYLSIQKPLIVNAKKKPYHSIDFNGLEVNTEYLAKYAKENGYDGVVVKNVYETDYENILCNDYIVFNSNQIKSIENKGNWSNSDNIYEALNKELENLLR